MLDKGKLMLLSWLFKISLLAIAGLLFIQWLLMIFRIERSLSVFGIQANNSSGHNMILGDIGGLMLGTSLMTFLFVLHSQLWMYPLMLMSLSVMLGRLISISQKGVNSIGVVGFALEFLGLMILLLFYFGAVLY